MFINKLTPNCNSSCCYVSPHLLNVSESLTDINLAHSPPPSAETKSVDEPIAKRLRNSTRTSNGEVLESFIKNPGLQHISEKIFQCLNKKSLMEYRLMNSSWNQILEQPIFWLKSWRLMVFRWNGIQDWTFILKRLLRILKPRKSWSWIWSRSQSKRQE